MSSNYEIVKIGLEEYNKCNNIWDMKKCPFTQQFVEQIKDNNRQVYICKINNEFVGECDLVLDYIDYTSPNKTIYLSRLIVKKEFRKQGIGTALVQYLINQCKAHGYTNITLGVDCDNVKAIQLYKKQGFKIYAQDKDEYGDYYKMILEL